MGPVPGAKKLALFRNFSLNTKFEAARLGPCKANNLIIYIPAVICYYTSTPREGFFLGLVVRSANGRKRISVLTGLSNVGCIRYNQSMQNQVVSRIPNIPPVQFVKEVVTELKKVTWPSRQETMKLTAVVIAISVIVGAFIGGLDYILISITSLIFKK